MSKTVVVITALSVLLSFSNIRSFVDAQTAFSYPSFPVEDGSILMSTSANVNYNSSQQSYDMTTPYFKDHTFLSGSYNSYCGRIVNKDKVRLVNRVSGKVASFNTSFTFSFESVSDRYKTWGVCGYGMVFTFAASPNISDIGMSITRATDGMCTFDIYDPSPTNTLFAVKFDSYRSVNFSDSMGNFTYGDPSDSNIGLVVRNKGTTTETQYDICANYTKDNSGRCQFFCGKQGDFTAWIDYDSAGQTLEVRFRNGSMDDGRGKPTNAVLTVYHLSLYDLLDDEMYVGFTSSSIIDYYFACTEIHRISSWNFTSSAVLDTFTSPPPQTSPQSSSPEPAPKSPSLAGLIGGVCAVGSGAALIGLCLFWFFKRKHRKRRQSFTAGLPSNTNNSSAYTFKELSSMTKSFSDSELLSSGAFGDVYRGTLPSGGLVAIKRIKHTTEYGQASFLAEVTSLGQIRHRNLLQLRGWCEVKEGLFLVYDFMSNGSLDKWLHPNPNASSKCLSWDARCSILAGVASGLEYLHDEWVQCVLHRDIKSSNVMLDEDFNPYVGDFGLARLVDHRKVQKTTMLAGTLGYMAPEMHYTGRATKQTDVYAFGMLVLEVVCGQTPLMVDHTSQAGAGVDQAGDKYLYLLDRVWRAHEGGNILKMVDPRLVQEQSEIHVSENNLRDGALETVTHYLQLGLLCCLPNPSERPSMRLVNQWFQSSEAGAMYELPSLPAKKPAPPGQSYITVPQASTEGTASSRSWEATPR